MTRHVPPPDEAEPVRTAHLGPDGALLPDEERRRRLMRAKLKHPAYVDALAAALRFETMTRPALEGLCFALLGRTGVGKSQIAKLVRRTLLEREAASSGLRLRRTCIVRAGGDWRPVLYVEVPSEVTIMSFAEEILRALSDEDPTFGTKAQKTARVRRKLQEQGVRLILCDEAQHFVEWRTDKAGFKAADWFKTILNEHDGEEDEDGEREGFFVHAAFFGRPAAISLFKENGQFFRRARGVHEFEAYDWIDPARRAVFLQVMRNVDLLLPFPNTSRLHDEDVALNMHRATDGVMSRVMTMLQMAGFAALGEGDGHIDGSLLEDAFDRLGWAVGDDDFAPRANPWTAGAKSPGDAKGKRQAASRKTRVRGRRRSTDPDFRKG